MMNSREELRSIKRRMLVEALNIKPSLLKKTLGLNGVLVSYVLRGDRKLNPREWELFRKLMVERVQELFQ